MDSSSEEIMVEWLTKKLKFSVSYARDPWHSVSEDHEGALSKKYVPKYTVSLSLVQRPFIKNKRVA